MDQRERLNPARPAFSGARIWLFALLGIGFALACGASSRAAPMGGETHFLSLCSDECSGGLECVAGVCTLRCDDGADQCSDLPGAAQCTQSGSASLCDVSCGNDDECDSVSADHECQAGFCRIGSGGTTTPNQLDPDAGNGGSAGAEVASVAGSTNAGGGGSTGVVPPMRHPCALSGSLAITAEQTALRLSQVLWNDEPDQVLLDAAAAGELGTRAEIASQAERMLDDERSYPVLWSFYSSWLTMHPPENVARPEILATLSQAFERETELFTRSLTLDPNGTFAQLLTAPRSFLDAELATHYGIEGSFTDTPQPVELNPEQRFGVLTQGHFLWTNPRPPQRGIAILERLQCAGPVPPPPPDALPFDPVLATENTTTRQAYEQAVGDPACQACHSLFTFVGFAFEHYDSVGVYRDIENGLAVDSSVEVINALPVNGLFSGVTELAPALAASAEVQRCFAAHWLGHLAGRLPYLDQQSSAAATDTPPDPSYVQTDTESLETALGCAIDNGELYLKRLVAVLAASPSVLKLSPPVP